MSILGITYADFGKGKYELHKGMYEQQKINQYIDKYEKSYLIKLLGVDLFNLFVAPKNEATNSPIHEFIVLQNVFKKEGLKCFLK